MLEIIFSIEKGTGCCEAAVYYACFRLRLLRGMFFLIFGALNKNKNYLSQSERESRLNSATRACKSGRKTSNIRNEFDGRFEFRTSLHLAETLKALR